MKDKLMIGERIKLEIERAPLDGGPYTGVPEEVWEGPGNSVVNPGLTLIADLIVGDTTSGVAHMAIGSGSTAVDSTDTSLVYECGRKAASTRSNVNNVITLVSTWGGNADSVTSVQIVEAGTFGHPSSGQAPLFQRVTFAAVTLADSDLLKITLQTNIGSGTIA